MPELVKQNINVKAALSLVSSQQHIRFRHLTLPYLPFPLSAFDPLVWEAYISDLFNPNLFYFFTPVTRFDGKVTLKMHLSKVVVSAAVLGVGAVGAVE